MTLTVAVCCVGWLAGTGAVGRVGRTVAGVDVAARVGVVGGVRVGRGVAEGSTVCGAAGVPVGGTAVVEVAADVVVGVISAPEVAVSVAAAVARGVVVGVVAGGVGVLGGAVGVAVATVVATAATSGVAGVLVTSRVAMGVFVVAIAVAMAVAPPVPGRLRKLNPITTPTRMAVMPARTSQRGCLRRGRT
jgi:hypothetical protein